MKRILLVTVVISLLSCSKSKCPKETFPCGCIEADGRTRELKKTGNGNYCSWVDDLGFEHQVPVSDCKCN